MILDTIVSVIVIGLPVLYLRMLDIDWIKYSSIEAKCWSVFYFALALSFLISGFYHVMRNENLKDGVLELILAVLYGVIAWELWKRGRPPRHKRKRVRNALRKLASRPIPGTAIG